MKYLKVEKDMTNAQYAKIKLQQHIKFGIDYYKLEGLFSENINEVLVIMINTLTVNQTLVIKEM